MSLNINSVRFFSNLHIELRLLIQVSLILKVFSVGEKITVDDITRKMLLILVAFLFWQFRNALFALKHTIDMSIVLN